MNTKQKDANFKFHMRRKVFNLAVLQMINNDPVEFQKRVARIMMETNHEKGNVIAESKLAIDEFIKSM